MVGNDDYTGKQIGSLSGIFSGNPYEGIYTTIYRVSNADEAQPSDTVELCAEGGGDCTWVATATPQFQESSVFLNDGVIPTGANSSAIQITLDEWCAAGQPDLSVYDDKMSQSSAELRIRGTDKRNKHPGSILSFDNTTTTTYEPGTSR